MLTAPNGGEICNVGQSYAISWAYSGPVDSVRIEINRDYPAGMWEVIVPATPNDGLHMWTVSRPTTVQARIRLYGTVYTWIGDTSAVEFSVIPTTITWLDSSSGGSWFDSTKWNPPLVPESQDTAVIGLPGNYEVVIDSGHARASSIELGSSNYTGIQWLTIGFPVCSLTVDGNITIHPGLGVLNIASGGRVFMAGTGVTLTDSGLLAQVLGGTLTLGFHDTLRVVGEGSVTLAAMSAIVGDTGFVWNSNQLLHPDADTSTIATNYKDDGGSTVLAVVVAEGALNFHPPDSAVFNSMVRVDSGATLRCSQCRFNSTSVITGVGTLSFEGGVQEVAGDFSFSGNIHVVSGVVNFNPFSPDSIAIDTFTIDSGATFTSSVTINAAVANMNGGSTNADITSNQYNWTAGDYVGGGGTDITVNPGTTLNIVGPVDKVLDTRNLVISGTADMSGSGIFSLLNGASITVSAGGTLTIGDSITITGPGDSLINYGQLTMSSPLDTIVINTFLWNSSSGRTTGTIDILSGKVESESIQNEGVVNIHGGATLAVTGSFGNLGSGVIYGAGTLDMMGGTLVNNGVIAPGFSPGILTINGNLDNLGIISIELGGTNPGTQYDRLLISGTLMLGGALNLSRIGGFVPSLTDTFHFLSFGDRSGVFSEVNGTAVGNGTFMEIAYRSNEIVQYVCSGVSDIQISAASILDTVLRGGTDTLTLQVCNEGHCPLVWNSTYAQHSPAGPPWLTITEGSSGQLERTLCKTMKWVINTAGLSPNTYSGDVVVTSNDPDEAVTEIPVQLVVPRDHVDNLVIRLNLATNSITLSWSAVPGANSYKVYRSNPGSYDPNVFLASTADTTYTHTGTLGGGGATRLVYDVVASTEAP